MRLDHVSYATSHEQISDVVNRIGSQIGTSFVDGGIHPRFGTRNFTAPLLNGQYIEVVCPMDHPATDSTPFGKAVKKKVGAGGTMYVCMYGVEQQLYGCRRSTMRSPSWTLSRKSLTRTPRSSCSCSGIT